MFLVSLPVRSRLFRPKRDSSASSQNGAPTLSKRVINIHPPAIIAVCQNHTQDPAPWIQLLTCVQLSGAKPNAAYAARLFDNSIQLFVSVESSLAASSSSFSFAWP